MENRNLENSKDNRKELNLEWIKSKEFPLKAQMKLMENQERKFQLQMLKKREKQRLIEKRKEKQNNIKKMLQSRYQERQAAKEMFQTYRKGKFSGKKLNQDDHHFPRWKRQVFKEKSVYEKKILGKSLHRSTNSFKKQKDDKKSEDESQKEKISLQKSQKQKKENSGPKEILRNKERRKKMRNIRKSEKSFKKHNIPQPNLSLNPIYNNLSLHYLGLNEKDKIKPKQILKDLLKFIDENKSNVVIEEDKNLYQQFENYLSLDASFF